MERAKTVAGLPATGFSETAGKSHKSPERLTPILVLTPQPLTLTRWRLLTRPEMFRVKPRPSLRRHCRIRLRRLLLLLLHFPTQPCPARLQFQQTLRTMSALQASNSSSTAPSSAVRI